MRTATPLLAVLALVPLVLAATGCAPRHQELPPPPPPAAPVSIWTAADAQAVAGQLIDAAAQDARASQFRDRNGRALRIAIGEITDRSGKHVATSELAAALRSAIGAGGDKLTLADGPADYTLRGSIAASEATEDGVAVTWFAIDLALVDAAGDAGWPLAVERRVAGR
jgi:hypothetical protein